MKNIIISPIPIKNLLTMFFVGFFGAMIAGFLFGIIGIVFANYLGFSLVGSELLAAEGSMLFYSVLAAPIGAFVAVYVASTKMKYTPKFLYVFLLALLIAVVGLFGSDYFDLYTYLLYAAVSSVCLTAVISYFASKSVEDC